MKKTILLMMTLLCMETAVNGLENAQGKVEGMWYDLNGRQLTSKPTAKGIYLNNGRKVVIK